MKVKNPRTEVPYWEEGQKPPYFHWYRKGYWKKYLRKKWIKNQIKNMPS